jgi:hypothetical protein
LNAQQLKERYIQLVSSADPNQPVVRNCSHFNEGLRVLLDPKLRLQHLLKLEGVRTADIVPESLSDAFLETGTLIQEVDRLLTKVTATRADKTLFQPEIAEKQRSIDDLIGKLEALQSKAIEELRALDELWISTHRIEHKLSDLAARFAHLSLWLSQLAERKFQLSIL